MEGYRVVGEAPLKHTAARRHPGSVWPGADAPTSIFFSDAACERLGSPEYVRMVMAEGKARPCVSVFHESATRPMTELFIRWYPELLKHIAGRITVAPVSIERASKIGGPFYERREDKARLMVEEVFPQFLAGDFSLMKGTHTIVNVRLQQEKRDKVREMPVVHPDGKVEIVKFDDDYRAFTYRGIDVFSARVRAVYNPPCANLYKLAVENALARAYKIDGVTNHDMYSYSRRTNAFGPYFLALDTKHFERNVGSLVRPRAAMISEEFAALQSLISDAPYASICTDWKTVKLLAADREHGFEVQLASGDSAVATVAKEALLCVYAAYYFERGYSRDKQTCMQLAFKGGDPSWGQFLNFGDDNFLYAQSKERIDDMYAFIARVLTVEEEVPPAFLGWLYTDVGGGNYAFRLRKSSYVKNFYKPERPPGWPFRPYFFLGRKLRRITYREYGEPGMPELLDEEDRFINDWGLRERYMDAISERELDRSKAHVPLDYVTGKDYLLSPEERAALGLAHLIPETMVRQILKQQLGKRFNIP